eukprot:6212425-Pleurochrysis_carterae.AAC.11
MACAAWLAAKLLLRAQQLGVAQRALRVSRAAQLGHLVLDEVESLRREARRRAHPWPRTARAKAKRYRRCDACAVVRALRYKRRSARAVVHASSSPCIVKQTRAWVAS